MSRVAPQQPVTDTTANAIPVNSTTGFAAGELIYYKNGDYAPISNSAVTSAPFDISQTQAFKGASSFGVYYTTGDNETVNYGSKSKCVAKLSNGNLVRVYLTYNSVYRPTFEIYNQSNVQVVAKTTISSTYTNNNYSAIAVAAFASGGFVVAWLNDAGGTANSINFAVYDNNGVATLSATQYTSVTVGASSNIFLAATSDNKFYIAVHNSGNVVYLTCFNQAGTAQFAPINTGITGSTGWAIGLTTRSDNSAALVSQNGAGSTSFGFRVYSSAGATLNTQTFTPTGSSANPACDIDCLSDGTTLVIGYNVYNSAYYWGYVTVPSSNVISAEYAIPASNSLNSPYVGFGSTGYNLVVKALSTGGWIMFFQDPSYAVVYAAFNSSGTCVSGTNATNSKAAPIYMPSSYWGIYMSAGVVETTDQVNFYAASSGGYASVRNPMVFCKISTSTWSLVPGNYRSQVVGTASNAVNAYSKSNSGPSYAKFVASSSGTLSYNGSMGYTSAVLPVTGAGVNALHSSTWNNGSFAVAYRVGTINYVNIYNSDAVLQTTITVGTTTAGTPTLAPNNTIRVACLAGGGLAVAWMKSSWTAITVSTYNSGYTLINEITSGTSHNMSGSTGGYNFDLAALATGGAILVWVYSYPYYLTTDSNGNNVINTTILSGYSSPYEIAVACDPWGGFGVSWSDNSSGVPRFFTYATYDGGATYSNLTSTSSMNTYSASYGSRKMVCTSTGIYFMSWYSASQAINIYSYTRELTTGPWSNGQTFTVGDFRGGIVGATGNGTLVVTNTHPSATLYAWGMNQCLFSSGSGGVPASLTLPLTGISPYNSTNSQLQNMTPMAGFNTLLTFINGSFQPYMVIINSYPYTATTPITSGSSLSSAVAVNPGTSGTLNGYILQGVSATAAGAGGSGLVQTNGTATLNSNYSASAPATTFDYTMPNGSGISGVKGNAIGRTVTLKGTS